MKRIRFFLLGTCLFLSLHSVQGDVEGVARVEGEREQPNIIFLMTDDQRWDNFGCYGRPEFKTHNIDRLADQGVIFDNAYYAVSICRPSRVTMLTGRYVSNHRVGFVAPNDYTLSQADLAESYPAKLKEAGYRTGFIGKVGFSVTEEAERPGFFDNYDYKKYFGDTFDFFAAGGPASGLDPAIWPEDDEALQAIYEDDRENSGRTLRSGEAMLRFLDTQPEDVPFCLSVSFNAVKHDRDEHVYPPDYALFKDYEFSVPENWVEGGNEQLPQVVRDNWRGHRLHLERTSTPDLYQNQVRRFAAQGYTVDQQVGLMMKKLEEKGMLENTVIIYTSDNGRFQGSHGLFDKALLYDESVKAPLIVWDGRVPESERGRREAAMISSVDMAPTILSLAGVDVPESMEGYDFTGVLDQSQNKGEWRQEVFMENLFLVELFAARRDPRVAEINDEVIAANRSYRCRGVRTDQWKYFVYYEYSPKIEELYNMDDDPLEQKNLAGDPHYAKVLKRLRLRTEELYKEIVR